MSARMTGMVFDRHHAGGGEMLSKQMNERSSAALGSAVHPCSKERVRARSRNLESIACGFQRWREVCVQHRDAIWRHRASCHTGAGGGSSVRRVAAFVAAWAHAIGVFGLDRMGRSGAMQRKDSGRDPLQERCHRPLHGCRGSVEGSIRRQTVLQGARRRVILCAIEIGGGL